jgi:glycosyltransferase involved in cell wall biosynthesis
LTTSTPDNAIGPNGETDWPWSTETPADQQASESTVDWPRISVVVPSYSQGQFIEATIRSILLQGYPNLEFFVMDGGSKDGTVEIIERYAQWIDHWESEPDRGQSHAINKGWERSTGSIVAWLNSDDTYTPGTLLRVGQAFMDNPGCASVSGNTRFETLAQETITVKEPKPFDPAHYLRGGLNPGQPSVFLARNTYQAVGELDESMSRSLDRDYWLRIGLKLPSGVHVVIRHDLAIAKLWEGNNASSWEGSEINLDYRGIHDEHMTILDKTFASSDLDPELHKTRRKAYALESMSHALTQGQIGHRFEAIKYAARSVLQHPKMLTTRSFLRILNYFILHR